MKKIFILLLLLTLITPIHSDALFDLDRQESIYLAVSLVSLFVGVKNNLVLASSQDQHPGRVVITALSYQSFITFFALVLDKKK